jgi:hypothetical protein
MLRMRVYRLAIPLTVFGMDMVGLFSVAAVSLISLQFFQSILPSVLPFLAAFAVGFGVLKLVTFLKQIFPGRAIVHMVLWLTQGDRYVMARERQALPIIVPSEEKLVTGLRRPNVRPQQVAVKPRLNSQAISKQFRPR